MDDLQKDLITETTHDLAEAVAKLLALTGEPGKTYFIDGVAHVSEPSLFETTTVTLKYLKLAIVVDPAVGVEKVKLECN